jgi:RNA polymerase sigma-70 factor (ECF subfamily)
MAWREIPAWIGAQGARFVTTDWSDLLAAGEGPSPKAQAALDRLYRTYSYPVYAYLRRDGHSPHDAQDVTQELFARLLAGNQLAGLSPHRGRFRSFLLVALKHYLINERQRAGASKRGGGQSLIPLDLILAEERYDLEPAHAITPERVFERRWALTLLENSGSARSSAAICAWRFVFQLPRVRSQRLGQQRTRLMNREASSQHEIVADR